MPRIAPLITFLALFAFFFDPSCNAADDPFRRNNAAALKIGAQMYRSSDFTDFWDIRSDNLVGPVFEFEYDRRITGLVFVDLTLGYARADANSDPSLLANTSTDVKVSNIYLSPTLKIQAPLNDSVSVYGGIGPDIYYTDSDIDISIGTASATVSDAFWSFGGHTLVGLEWLFYKEPARDNRLDAPLGLIFEYKFAIVPINDFDQKAIDTANNALGTSYSANDFDAGGHFLMVGLRWHF